VSPVNIGKTTILHGELTANEDLTIEGRVEGKIELRQHVLTIGVHGKVKSEILAKSVIVLGEVDGNIIATDKVDIRNAGSVDGDIVSPRVAIAEGAHFRGSIDMQRKPSVESKPTSDFTSMKPKAKDVTAAPVRELPLSRRSRL
jgi:cytoskeletal protein CcmA (bactofilin family)